MGSSNFGAWKSAIRPHLIWVEFEGYARRVFAGDPPDWWQNAARYAATITQAHAVIPTQILSIDALAPFLMSAPANPPCAENIEALLQQPAPRAFLDEVLDALAHRFAGHVDMVLKVPSPRELLMRRAGAADPDFDALDDCSMALANFIRPLAGRPLAGLQVYSRSTSGIGAAELEACDPLFGAARHYNWFVAIELQCLAGNELPPPVADIVLLPECAPALIATADAARSFGGGLGAGFWQTEEIPEAVPALLSGAIPPAAVPERVLRRMKWLARLQ